MARGALLVRVRKLKYMADLSVNARIVLIALILSLAAITLALVSLSESRTWLQLGDAILAQVETSRKTSALIHELQKERGTSAGFTASYEGQVRRARCPYQHLPGKRESRARARDGRDVVWRGHFYPCHL